MSKTIQVKVKIEDFFGSLFILQIKNPYEPSWLSLIDEVYTVVGTKVQRDSFDTANLSAYFYKDGESRPSIIKALYEYQKSLLPEGYKIVGLNKDKLERKISIYHNSSEMNDVELIDFYDPTSRIITVTKWTEGD